MAPITADSLIKSVGIGLAIVSSSLGASWAVSEKIETANQKVLSQMQSTYESRLDHAIESAKTRAELEAIIQELERRIIVMEVTRK